MGDLISKDYECRSNENEIERSALIYEGFILGQKLLTRSNSVAT